MPFDFDPAAHGLTLDETQTAALKAALGGEVQKFLDGEVSGLKSKNTELIGSNKTIKAELDKLKGQFDGLDIEAVKDLLAKAGQDEETKLIAEGKLDEVISRRTERLRTDLDKQVKAANERADKAEAFAAKYSDKVLADSIRAAAIKAGALPEAAEDIILRARGTFKLSEDGEPIATDRAGEVVYGKDGKTPLSPSNGRNRCAKPQPTCGQGLRAPGRPATTVARPRRNGASTPRPSALRWLVTTPTHSKTPSHPRNLTHGIYPTVGHLRFRLLRHSGSGEFPRENRRL